MGLLTMKTSLKRWLIVITVIIGILLGWHFWGSHTANATAAQAPYVVAAKLNGKLVYVLYMTRSSDTVLVRCYPGQTPTLSVNEMGGQAGVKEGTLVCK